MGLAEDLDNAAPSPKGEACSVGRLLAEDGPLSLEERQALNRALDDPSKQHNSLSRVLNAHGHKIASQTIGRHRRRDCQCP